MVDDVVRGLGYLMLGTRLKRIGERLQADATRIAAAHGADVQSNHYPFLYALEQFGPLTIGELAEAIGITQPGVTRMAGQLAKLGTVTVRPGRADKRQRIVTLTPAGVRLLELGRRELWPLVEAAVADLCEPLSGPLLDQLTAIEEGLDDRPLEKRTGLDGRKGK